jgi:putative ABC transport system substrate-binding protein
MRRRAFLVCVGAVIAPCFAGAQPATRRIAFLEFGEKVARAGSWRVTEARLRELGYVEGANLIIDRRWAGGAIDRLPVLAQELLAGRPELVLVNSTPATLALMRLTDSVPIVFTSVADPVAAGIVPSLARPGGNVTGFSAQLTDVNEKRFDLMREILPQAKRFGLLGPASNLGVQAVLKRLQAAARSIGADVSLQDASDAATIRRAFERLRSESLDALLVASVLMPHNRLVVDLAEKSRIPASFIQQPMLEAGALVVFGPQSDA